VLLASQLLTVRRAETHHLPASYTMGFVRLCRSQPILVLARISMMCPFRKERSGPGGDPDRTGRSSDRNPSQPLGLPCCVAQPTLERLAGAGIIGHAFACHAQIRLPGDQAGIAVSPQSGCAHACKALVEIAEMPLSLLQMLPSVLLSSRICGRHDRPCRPGAREPGRGWPASRAEQALACRTIAKERAAS